MVIVRTLVSGYKRRKVGPVLVGDRHRLGKNGKKFVCHIVHIIFCTFCTEMWYVINVITVFMKTCAVNHLEMRWIGINVYHPRCVNTVRNNGLSCFGLVYCLIVLFLASRRLPSTFCNIEYTCSFYIKPNIGLLHVVL
jgi:ABC-type Fe3+ transport system permease subunit